MARQDARLKSVSASQTNGPSGKSSKSAGHLHGLDILRFVAACFVLLYHFAAFSSIAPAVVADESQRAFPFLDAFDGVGAVGVEIFFVISGFVISMSAARLSGTAGALRFAANRALRILPALWISGMISVVALCFTGEAMPSILARFARSAILSPVGPYVDGVVWSLVVEAVFYALIGLCIARRASLPVRSIALGLGFASAAYLVIYLGVATLGHSEWAALLNRFPFKVFLLRHGVFFAIGMLLWAARDNPAQRPSYGLIAGFSVMGLVEIWLKNRFDLHNAIDAMAIWLAGMLWLGFSLRFSIGKRFRGLFRFLGNLSYPLYLNHHTTGMVIVWLLERGGFGGVEAFVIATLAVLTISTVVVMAEERLHAILRPRIAQIGAKHRLAYSGRP